MFEKEHIMGLATFIQTHEHEIVKEWEIFAQNCKPAADELDPVMLRDHIRDLLRSIIKDLRAPPLTEQEREEKAKGIMPKEKYDPAALTHGEIRFRAGFNIVQVHLEFCALRSDIIKLWSNEWTRSNRDWSTPAEIIPELIILNEAIDKMVSDSLSSYVESARQSDPAHAPLAASELKVRH
jgi:hypothetical protein